MSVRPCSTEPDGGDGCSHPPTIRLDEVAERLSRHGGPAGALLEQVPSLQVIRYSDVEAVIGGLDPRIDAGLPGRVQRAFRVVQPTFRVGEKFIQSRLP